MAGGAHRNKLDNLEEGSNWSVVYFLLHHRDTRHLQHILQATPRGSYGQRCAFLEDVLDYVKMCAHAPVIGSPQVREAAQYVLDQATAIEMDIEQSNSPQRVDRIDASATELRSDSTAFPKP